jgi:hypothetical protein
MNAVGEQWALTSLEVDAANTSDTQRAQRTDRAVVAVSNGLTITSQASFVSMDANGFTVNFTSANNAGQVASLALAGVRSRLGSFAKATAVGTQAVGGSGFRPSAVMLASYDATASTTAQNDGRFVLGASDGTIQATASFIDVNGAGTSNTWGLDKASKVLSTIGTAGTVSAEANLSSLDADGFTLNWTTNAAPASEVLYLSLGAP